MPIPRIPELAIASHTPSEREYHPSRGATSSRQSAMNRGTLNIFSGNYTTETGDEAAELSSHRMTRYSAVNLQSGRHYHNRESKETREFPSACMRHVRLPKHSTPVHGIKQFSDATGNKQQVQVVNITRTYADPANMAAPRPCVRCDSGKGRSDELKSILAYRSLGEDQLKGGLASTPLGKPRRSSARHVIDSTRQENFLKAVSDHVHQRMGGVAGFYVLLARGAIGDVVPVVPGGAPSWAFLPDESGSRRSVLVLSHCRDQLVSLVGIPVTLLELADLIWGPGDPKGIANMPEEELQLLGVPFKDFAAAFGTNLSRK